MSTFTKKHHQIVVHEASGHEVMKKFFTTIVVYIISPPSVKGLNGDSGIAANLRFTCYATPHVFLENGQRCCVQQ
jgi:hypothetical protein